MNEMYDTDNDEIDEKEDTYADFLITTLEYIATNDLDRAKEAMEEVDRLGLHDQLLDTLDDILEYVFKQIAQSDHQFQTRRNDDVKTYESIVSINRLLIWSISEESPDYLDRILNKVSIYDFRSALVNGVIRQLYMLHNYKRMLDVIGQQCDSPHDVVTYVLDTLILSDFDERQHIKNVIDTCKLETNVTRRILDVLFNKTNIYAQEYERNNDVASKLGLVILHLLQNNNYYKREHGNAVQYIRAFHNRLPASIKTHFKDFKTILTHRPNKQSELPYSMYTQNVPRRI